MGLLSKIIGNGNSAPDEKIHNELDQVIVELDKLDNWIMDNKNKLNPEIMAGSLESSPETAERFIENGLKPKVKKVRNHIGTVENHVESLEREAKKDGASDRLKHDLKLSEKALKHLEEEEQNIEAAVSAVERQIPDKNSRRVTSKEENAFKKLEEVTEREDDRLHKLKELTDGEWQDPR